MKITAIQCILVSAPYATPDDDEHRFHLRLGVRPAAFIRVNTDEGLHGVGETYAGVYAPEAVVALVKQFERDMIGQDAANIAAAWERMHLACRYWGRTGLSQSVLGGIEMALWDLRGKALGVPVHQLLGGAAQQAITVYASGGNNKPDDELRQEMRDYVQHGFSAIKIRINNLVDLSAIVRKVALCHEAVAGQARLAADAAQGLAKHPWTVKEALEVARALEPFDLLWLEEPAAVTDYESFARIRAQASMPIAGGETVTSLTEAEAYLKAGALDLFQPDASLIGGLSILRQVAQMCERQGVPIAVHSWSAGVGLMGNYHAAFASGNCRYLEMSCVPNPLRDDVLVEPLQWVKGKIAVPRAPGLGVALPDDLEERYPYREGSLYRVLGYEELKGS